MIKITGIKKIFNADTIISLKDYAFEKGKSYCLLGPSGSGKSTLLNLIAGIVKPTEGEITVDETIVSEMSQKELDRFRYDEVGYIPQDLKLFEEFTVMDNLSIVGVGGSLVFEPETVLEWVDLKHKAKSKVKTLSGGERQRVAIARALMKSPKVMLCDEPTGSLNFKKGVVIIELLINLHKDNRNTLIVVTHDERMSNYFDEVIRFEDFLTESVAKGGAINA